MGNSFTFLKTRIEASDLEEERKRVALSNLKRSNFDERVILQGILETKAAWAFAGEILRGAHVRIFDMGARYNDWSGLSTAGTRRSSHASDGLQYRVNGPLVSTVLFGKIGNWTWVQLEGHPQGLDHVIDWVKYSLTKKNQGPYGASSHVENRPVQIPSPGHHVPLDWVHKTKMNPRSKMFQ